MNYINENVEVINAGVGSYMSWQEMSYLALELISCKPTYVIALDGLNDLRWSEGGYTAKNLHPSMNYFADYIQNMENYKKKPHQLLFSSNFLRRVFSSYKITSKLLNLIKDIKNIIQNNELTKNTNTTSHQDIDIYNSVKQYITNLNSMIGIAHFNNSKFIHLFQPQLIFGKRKKTEKENEFINMLGTKNKSIVKYAPHWYKAFSKEYEKLSKSHNGTDIWIEDASSCLDNYEETVFHDWCHYNEAGNKYISEYIFNIIKKMGIH